MRISDKTIEVLANVISGTGVFEKAPYKSGPQLVDFFNGFGVGDIYGSGFPSRFSYNEDKLHQFNGTDTMKSIINAAIEPLDYNIDKGQYPNEAAIYLNKALIRDGYKLVERNFERLHGHHVEKELLGYEITALNRDTINPEKTIALSHSFIFDQINKCKKKLDNGDYDGAITNARSLSEAIQIEVIKKCGHEVPKYNGDLLKLYKSTKKALNLHPEKDWADTVKQILTGLTSIVSGLAGISNMMADRHSRKYKPNKHHAGLAINAAFTFCEFLLDSYEYQLNKKP